MLAVPQNVRTRTCLDLDQCGVVVRVPETTLEAKHHALHVQPHGLREDDSVKKKTVIASRGRGLVRSGVETTHTGTSV